MEYITGKQVVQEALRSGLRLRQLYVEDRLAKDPEWTTLVARSGLQPLPFPEELKGELVHSQGVAAAYEGFPYRELDQVLKTVGEESLVVVLDHLEDPHNLGAIIRTALCGGADAIIIPDDRSVRVNQTVLKVSSGAAFHIPVIKVKNIAQTLDTLKGLGYWAYGADMDGQETLFQASLQGKICLVVGNEGKGLSPLVKKRCDGLISIPQVGPLGSLNVSVATGIIIYEVLRKRNS